MFIISEYVQSGERGRKYYIIGITRVIVWIYKEKNKEKIQIFLYIYLFCKVHITKTLKIICI